MPELPEVEVLARRLRPVIRGRIIRAIDVRHLKVLRPTSIRTFQRTLPGARFTGLSRRGKYLLFQLRPRRGKEPILLVGHLGMTGRIFPAKKGQALPRHATVVFDLGTMNLIFEDPRRFGRLNLDGGRLERLGPEPLSDDFTEKSFARELKRSRQAIKIKLLDQRLVAGIGNIYASEALFRARISPRLAANRLTAAQVGRLARAIRQVLTEAIAWGSTVPVTFSGGKRIFYFEQGPEAEVFHPERLWVYDRAGQPCPTCGGPIKRIVQGARSTFYCPRCVARQT